MASNTIDEITEELLVCQICLEDFKQPKMLPCLHTFCQQCLERLLATEPVGKLSCPTCRQDVPLPRHGIKRLKSNFLVGKLHDILQQRTKGKGKSSATQEGGKPCTVCDQSNLADFYCVDCVDYLCQTCNDVHSGLKATRSHKVVRMQDLQSGQFAAYRRARETSKCEAHKELNKFYCDTCHRVICLHCVVMAHKDHRYVEIEEAAKRERAKIKEKLTAVKNTANVHEKWLENLWSVKNKWSSQVQRTEEQIYKQAETVIQAVKKVTKNRIYKLRSISAAREAQMETAIEAAETDLALSRSCIQFTENLLESGSPAKVMSVARKMPGRFEEASDVKIAEKAKLTRNLVNLNYDPPTERELEQELAKLIGGVKQMTIPILNTFPLARPNVSVSVGDGSPEVLKIIGGKGGNNGEFSFPSSLVTTTRGDIVVTDRDNSRLQFFDKDGAFKKKVGLGFRPQCVAAVANGDLLVTGDGHSIHVLNKHGKELRAIQVTGATKKSKPTKGITVDCLGRIIVTIAHQVFVLSPRGDIVLKFGENGQGQRQFSWSLFVTVNCSNQIIVSDCGNDNVKIFDPAGRHLFTFGSHGSGPGQLHRPFCVISDSEDNIIVVEHLNHRVSVFGRDRTFIRHLLTRNLHNPRGITLTRD